MSKTGAWQIEQLILRRCLLSFSRMTENYRQCPRCGDPNHFMCKRMLQVKQTGCEREGLRNTWKGQSGKGTPCRNNISVESTFSTLPGFMTPVPLQDIHSDFQFSTSERIVSDFQTRKCEKEQNIRSYGFSSHPCPVFPVSLKRFIFYRQQVMQCPLRTPYHFISHTFA